MNIRAFLSEEFDNYFSTLAIPTSPSSLYEPISYFLNIGGKRLRPYALLLAAYSRNQDISQALPAAAAIELFHNFTLIHDDVMDKSMIRRGFETIHEKYNLNTALLSGDALLLLAYRQLLLSPVEYWPRIIPIFNDTATQVCEGQQMDMDFEHAANITEKEYLQMIGLKTSVLIAAAMQMGAIIGGADVDESLSYYHFAYHLGVAFQIQDDILDCFGNEDLIGKKNGGDISNNKKTILTIFALRHEANREILFGTYNNEKEKISTVKELYVSCGAYDYALDLRNSLLQKGMKYLQQMKLSNEIRPLFEQLVNQLIVRTF